MKKITYSLLILLFVTILSNRSYSQVSRIPYYDQINFNGAFYSIAETDEKSDYYVIDLNMFKSDFEKDYFINATFQEQKIVRIDAGNSNMAWFKAKKVFTQKEIGQLFTSLKEQTELRATSMTEFQKNEWLNRNGK